MGSPLQAKKRRQKKKYNNNIGEAQRALTRLSKTASRKDFYALCEQLIKSNVKIFAEGGNILEDTSYVVLDWAHSIGSNDDIYENIDDIKKLIGPRLINLDQPEKIRSYTTVPYSDSVIYPMNAGSNACSSAYIDEQLPAYTIGDWQTVGAWIDKMRRLMRDFSSLPKMGIVMLVSSAVCIAIGGISLWNCFVTGASCFPPVFSSSLVLLGLGWAWTVLFSI